ncbi:MAG: AAA-like domain-containing protein [Crocosphaera sp.]
MSSSVPKLDLSPKLNRPLSLWNPLDYLLLLYWVFFFPQALGWYEKKWGSEKKLSDYKTWEKKWKFLKQYPQQLQLVIQGILLTLSIPFFIVYILQILGVINDLFPVGVALFYVIFVGVMIGLNIQVAVGVGLLVVGGVVVGVGHGITYELASKGLYTPAYTVLAGVVIGVTIGMTIGVLGGVTIGVTIGMTVGVVGGVIVGGTVGMMVGVLWVIVLAIFVLRPENWLLECYLSTWLLKQRGNLISRTTVIPLPNFSSLLETWLQEDWQVGIHNLNQILQYSLQFIPVIKALNEAITKIPDEQLIYRFSQLSEITQDWDLVKYCSASLEDSLKHEALDGFFFLFPPLRRTIKSRFNTDLRIDTSSHAIAAGFWYLHKKKPSQATAAFQVTRSLLYGKEMYLLSAILTRLDEAETVQAVVNINLPNFPQTPYLRPNTWQVIRQFQTIISNVQEVEQGTTIVRRSTALNRAIGDLRTIIERGSKETKIDKFLPEAERDLIINIAKQWKSSLETIATEVGDITINEPITSPYVIGDPVFGQLFIGRDDILRELKELWTNATQVQSVILYGHRRMGKTSILRNINTCLDGNIKLAYLNLQSLGEMTQGTAEIVMAMSDEISEVLDISAPNDADFLESPELTFRRFLKRIEKEMTDKGLIIALDEFETLESLIEEKKISKKFMEILRTWVQMSPKIAFIFAGLHTLEEMSSDYFHPFYASFSRNILVSFLSKPATNQLLEAPNENFTLQYSTEALEKIYNLTNGQPYLVNLIGFYLIRRFNDSRFNQKKKTDNKLTLEDVEAIINANFFKQGSYYFHGIWSQAEKLPFGQQEIIKLLAPYQQGLTMTELLEKTTFTELEIGDILKSLKRHDVIEEKDDKYTIIVELFRQWVTDEYYVVEEKNT